MYKYSSGENAVVIVEVNTPELGAVIKIGTIVKVVEISLDPYMRSGYYAEVEYGLDYPPRKVKIDPSYLLGIEEYKTLRDHIIKEFAGFGF